jgi:N6-adenosine-specific RNA methylase IME4
MSDLPETKPDPRDRRRDWRGERVLLSGRVAPPIREAALQSAQLHGLSVGDFLTRLIEPTTNGSGRVSAGRAAAPALPQATFGTILADPPWRFVNRTGKVAPEHRRLSRYDTLTTEEIASLPVASVADPQSHLYLWVPNALLAEGLDVMRSWGFHYKSNLVWHKVRKDGASDGRGVGFYFRNVTELILFGIRGRLRTLSPARSQVNLLASRKREHSRKPDELYDVIERCSPGPYLELFARYPRDGWSSWGSEAAPEVVPRGRQYPAYR